MPATKIETGVYIELKRLRLTAIARKHRPDKTASLARSLKEGGVQIQDIVVCPHDEAAGAASEFFDVLAGVGRKEAEESLGWEKGRCTIMYGLSPYEKLKVTLDENEERQEAGPLDEGILYQAMLDADKDLTQKELARRRDMSQPRLNDYLTAARLPQGVREIIRYLINLNLDHLVQICRLKRPEDQLELAKKADQEGWTVGKLKTEVNKRLPPEDLSQKKISQIKKALFMSAQPEAPKMLPDPLAVLWAKEQEDKTKLFGEWAALYGERGCVWKLPESELAPSVEGWVFWVVKDYQKPQEALGDWFATMAKRLGGKAAPIKDPVRPLAPKSPQGQANTSSSFPAATGREPIDETHNSFSPNMMGSPPEPAGNDEQGMTAGDNGKGKPPKSVQKSMPTPKPPAAAKAPKPSNTNPPDLNALLEGLDPETRALVEAELEKGPLI